MILKLMLTRSRALLFGSTEWGSQAENSKSVPIPHPHDHLIRIVRGERRYRGPDDRGLNARVVEVDGIGARLRLHVIDPAKEIIGWLCTPWDAPMPFTLAQQPVISKSSEAISRNDNTFSIRLAAA